MVYITSLADICLLGSLFYGTDVDFKVICLMNLLDKQETKRKLSSTD